MGCVVDGRDGPSLAVTAVDLLLSRNARDLAECGRQLEHFNSRTHRLGWTECDGAFRRLLVKTPLLRATCMDV